MFDSIGQYVSRRQNGCDLCGLPNVQHANTGGCVLDLRRECDQLRSSLAQSVPPRDESVGRAEVCSFAGYGLVVIGAVFSLGRTFVHLALALSLWELATCPGFVGGVAAIVAGAALIGIAHGRLIGRPPRSGSTVSMRQPRHADCQSAPVAIAQ